MSECLRLRMRVTKFQDLMSWQEAKLGHLRRSYIRIRMPSYLPAMSLEGSFGRTRTLSRRLSHLPGLLSWFGVYNNRKDCCPAKVVREARLVPTARSLTCASAGSLPSCTTAGAQQVRECHGHLVGPDEILPFILQLIFLKSEILAGGH